MTLLSIRKCHFLIFLIKLREVTICFIHLLCNILFSKRFSLTPWFENQPFICATLFGLSRFVIFLIAIENFSFDISSNDIAFSTTLISSWMPLSLISWSSQNSSHTTSSTPGKQFLFWDIVDAYILTSWLEYDHLNGIDIILIISSKSPT